MWDMHDTTISSSFMYQFDCSLESFLHKMCQCGTCIIPQLQLHDIALASWCSLSLILIVMTHPDNLLANLITCTVWRCYWGINNLTVDTWEPGGGPVKAKCNGLEELCYQLGSKFLEAQVGRDSEEHRSRRTQNLIVDTWELGGSPVSTNTMVGRTGCEQLESKFLEAQVGRDSEEHRSEIQVNFPLMQDKVTWSTLRNCPI